MSKISNSPTVLEIQILETKLKVYQNGMIERWMKTQRWKEIKNNQNHKQGYNVVLINGKQFMRSRIIAYAFLNSDLFNRNAIIHHKDGNGLNSDINNLLVCSPGEANKKSFARKRQEIEKQIYHKRQIEDSFNNITN